MQLKQSAPKPEPQIETARLGDTDIRYTVRRNPRAKRMKITITPYAGVVVTLPARLPRYINPEEFLRENQAWVLKHIARVGFDPHTPQTLGDGADIPYRGKNYTLQLQYDAILFPIVGIAEDTIIITLPLTEKCDPKLALLQWMKEKAARTIQHEVEKHAERIGVSYSRLTVRDQRTKWGSCSRNRSLSFNWRLILFPPGILRYIVIHELCHIKHFNHSQRFWDLVNQHAPDYHRSVTWLHEHGLRADSVFR